MAQGKRRQKAQADRAKRRAQKFARYEQRKDKLPNPETKFGRRWWDRRAGRPINNRSHEPKPWFYAAVMEAHSRFDRAESLAAQAA